HSAEEWKRPDARTWQVSIASDTPCVGTTKLAAKPAPAAPSAPPAPSAAWAVQLIGDRLESNALSRYAQLQKKYQAILGGREPLVVRTTMGQHGDLASHQHRGGYPRSGRDAVLAAARGGRRLPRPEQLNVARRTLALSLRGWHGGQPPCRAQRGSPRRGRPNSDVFHIEHVSMKALKIGGHRPAKSAPILPEPCKAPSRPICQSSNRASSNS